MKNSLRVLLLCFALSAGRAFAGSGANYSTTSTAGTSAETTDDIAPFEFDAQASYIGESDVERSFRKVRGFDEGYGYARFLYLPRTKVGYLRLGVAYERFEFGIPQFGRIGGSPANDSFIIGRPQLPETLQSISGAIGLDTKFSDSFLFRIEAQPGLYGTNNLDADSFHVPVIIGGSYIVNPNLQFLVGVSVDYERKYPVFPGGGVRWRMSSQWVLNAAVPTPRLEFEATKNLTIYAGADIKGSVFRVGDHFGEARGDLRLNHALLTYTEVRTGGGVDFKISPGCSLAVEGGYLPYREFDYHRADIRYTHESGAPYGSVALKTTF